MSDFTKSKGLTASERYLAELCEHSFLSLWSYPNVYRAPGKELCDILIVFQNHIIIFSDKSCLFPATEKVRRDWSRWFKRAVYQSARQVYGAERWLREHPDRLFLDPKCSQPFPLAIPRLQDATIHRVVVALNASGACRAFFNNSGSGSLILRPDIVGDAHYDHPFTIGTIDAGRGYVHVFDDVTLNIALRELDTITDFTNYLTRKETAFCSGRLFYVTGEEELLAHYLTEVNENGRHDLVLPKEIDGVLFAEGSWASVSAHPQYIAKKHADQKSYAWDTLIEKFNEHATYNPFDGGNTLPLSEYEHGVRIMASEGRVSRRMLADGFLDLLQHAPADRDATRLIFSKQSPERGYQFVICRKEENEPYVTYRQRRLALLAAYCHVAKVRRPELLDIVGIATEPVYAEERSEDLIYLNLRDWTLEDERSTRELQVRTGIHTRTKEIWVHSDEYPDLPTIAKPPSEKIAKTGNRKERRAMRAKLRKSKEA